MRHENNDNKVTKNVILYKIQKLLLFKDSLKQNKVFKNDFRLCNGALKFHTER